MGKLSEAAIVNSINSEYVLLTDSNGLPVRISKNNLAEAVRNVMSEATTEKNGLKPANEVRMEKRLSASNSLIIFEPEISTNPKSTSLLISVAASGGGVMSHYLMSINRASESMKKPTIILNRIGGLLPLMSPNLSYGLTKILELLKLYWNEYSIPLACMLKF
ncbi:hypothetical protein BcellWH2_00775 [Bacteroides cellulosilyticus]|uniref:Uncharacterized protein n=1 Tax=Bacteroides cellulosilyticus TaxID=246787 RepID=A0A0P0GLN3_9BACE|nr:hypothetical protein [Bacteroides cellulosilyticus]ALJ58038.1 hypothetical protein BcellWH2_00775 [Bacteroides cellulosilyticus]